MIYEKNTNEEESGEKTPLDKLYMVVERPSNSTENVQGLQEYLYE